jgi:ribonuclease-3
MFCLDRAEAGSYPVGTTVDNFLRIQIALGITFHDSNLLQQALVHRSYLNEAADGQALASNERLEFLGDAVLGLVVTEELYRRFPHLPEGRLTEMRARLVRGATLDLIGEQLDLGSLLVLGRGEEQSGGRRRSVNLGRALEALIGAAYLDRGLEVVREMTLRLLSTDLEALRATGVGLDAKSSLQQFAQGVMRVTPEYVTVSAEGPDHAREFVVEVRLGGEAVATGRGRNTRQAQQAAAAAALDALAPRSDRAGSEGLDER